MTLYVDPESGVDTNLGNTVYNPLKTIALAATNDSDIKVKKTNINSVGTNATFTNKSSTVVLASPLTADIVMGSWSSNTDGIKISGSGSAFNVGITAGTNNSNSVYWVVTKGTPYTETVGMTTTTYQNFTHFMLFALASYSPANLTTDSASFILNSSLDFNMNGGYFNDGSSHATSGWGLVFSTGGFVPPTPDYVQAHGFVPDIAFPNHVLSEVNGAPFTVSGFNSAFHLTANIATLVVYRVGRYTYPRSPIPNWYPFQTNYSIGVSNLLACNKNKVTLNTLIGLNNGEWWGITGISGTNISLGGRGFSGTTTTGPLYSVLPSNHDTGIDVYNYKDIVTTKKNTSISGGWNFSASTYTTGTVSSSFSSVITGSSTDWSGITPGLKIGFGTTDPTLVTTWYTVTYVQSPTSLFISESIPIFGSTSYVILYPPVQDGLTFLDGFYSSHNLFSVSGASYSPNASLSNFWGIRLTSLLSMTTVLASVQSLGGSYISTIFNLVGSELTATSPCTFLQCGSIVYFDLTDQTNDPEGSYLDTLSIFSLDAAINSIVPPKFPGYTFAGADLASPVYYPISSRAHFTNLTVRSCNGSINSTVPATYIIKPFTVGLNYTGGANGPFFIIQTYSPPQFRSLGLLIDGQLVSSNNAGYGFSIDDFTKVNSLILSDNSSAALLITGDNSASPVFIKSMVATNNSGVVVIENPSRGVKIYNLTTSGNGDSPISLGDHPSSIPIALNGLDFVVHNWTYDETNPYGGLTVSLNDINNQSTDWKFKSQTDNGVLDKHVILCTGGTIKSDSSTVHNNKGLGWRVAPTSVAKNQYNPISLSIAKLEILSATSFTLNAWIKASASPINCRIRIPGYSIGGITSDIVSSTVTSSTYTNVTLSGTSTEAGVVEVFFDTWITGSNSTAYGEISDISCVVS